MTVLNTIEDYVTLVRNLPSLPDSERAQMARHLCRTDLYFLLWFGCGRKDMAHPWLLARCKEVQASPNGHLDCWARDHYKSTIITFGLTMQDILAGYGNDNHLYRTKLEPTIGIFAFNRTIAKGFLKQLKREFEQNQLLKDLFPDILHQMPERDAVKWSDDEGLIFKRKTNPKEACIEAWGYVEGQPTSKHFNIIVGDDLVTYDSVLTPSAMTKCVESWELMQNLSTENGIFRYIGTRYHMNDLYRTMMERKTVHMRVHAATDNGEVDGNPVLISRARLEEKYRASGAYTFYCQMLQNPKGSAVDAFQRENIQYYEKCFPESLNRYIIVDPANSKKKTGDYTAAWVIGLGTDKNYYVIDMIRDRLSLTERGDLVFTWHRKYRPLGIGYEQYGMQADIDYFKDRMSRENYRFNITPLGGKLAKIDRIRQLIPITEEKRLYLPQSCYKTNYESKTEDLVDIFINQELLSFPVPFHDDMMDSLARILDTDMHIVWPKEKITKSEDKWVKATTKSHRSGWAS